MWDYVEFVAEYAPWTMHDLDNIGRAVELFPNFTAMIKIEQDTRGHLALRAIGSGIQNVLFADIRTSEDALQCVRAARPEHPRHGGLHGVGMRRDARTVLYGASEAWMMTVADSVVVLMIEKKEAFDNLDAILAVKGVDMVQFGPADYAMSMGLSLETDLDQIREAEEHMIRAALQCGIQPRAELRDPVGAERYLSLGVKHFCIGNDVLILHDWWTRQGAAMRDLLAQSRTSNPTVASALPTQNISVPARS
jgi:4-hydroxy-2-oxoheptanedioate aldolase